MSNGRRIHHFNNKGMKSEGMCIYGKPVGFGMLYNENNQIIYKGYVNGLIKICSGTVYNPDTEGVKYTGGFCNNERCGYGKLYNKENKQVYAGEWDHDLPLQRSLLEYCMKYDLFNSYCQEINITDMKIDEDNWSFRIINFENLERVCIDNFVLNYVQCFEISRCNKLKSVEITGEYDKSDGNIRNKENFTIKDCLNMTNIHFDSNSCQYFTSFVLSSMKRQLIIIGRSSSIT